MSVEGQAPHPLGSEVTYHCDDGLFPTGVMTSTCTDVGRRGEWVPDPAQLICRAAGRPDLLQSLPHTTHVYVECIQSQQLIFLFFFFSQSPAGYQKSLNMDSLWTTVT